MNSDCLFCKIIKKETPAKMVHEDELCIAFRDINPQSPTHILIVPRKHIEKLSNHVAEDQPLMGHLHSVACALAKKEKLKDFRVVINNGAEAGQTVWHLHLHLLGGRIFSWPPG